ncbi:hypothetical protein [Micrococcus sp. IITD107]|uniref:hypothetical protein n=1 Tax=Micrococcus sp. IITD107 TaxID=3342790 RepID=UPI0035BB8F28
MDAFPTQHQQHPAAPASPAPQKPRKPWYKRWWAIALGVVLAIGVIANLGGNGQDSPTATDETTPASSPSSSSASPSTSAPASPSTSASATAVQATEVEESESPTSTPTPTPSEEPEPTPTEEPEPVEADPSDYEKLTARDLALITKDPDAHMGRQVQVYAHITQFDAATGDCIFRGNASQANMADTWDYEHNSMFMAETGIGCEALSDFVGDDQVHVLATVLMSMSYDTQIGGSTTVPVYQIDGIELVQ